MLPFTQLPLFLNVILCQTSFWALFLEQLKNTSALEWTGTVTGFLCVYLAARQHILNWPVSIISVISYLVLFYNYKLYGDAALQLYFLGTAGYGWYYWLKRKEEHKKPIVSLSSREYVLVIAAIAAFSIGLGAFLDNFTDTDVPYIDGTCTAISFVAQFLMTRKILQNWILWIVVDICYVPLYIYKDLALTAVLYTLFLVLAAMGYLDWKKTWKAEAA
ncbi:nicotinamide riboside transporter PnuC [Pedobacter sp. SYSU D00535]|uniref:nicotinamide riboside transporter PnuC n=1 Tax=Pedobacter sp. SYSU D00535 TaxID=2810308 RepID=UPI001A95A354|nr:nicotinamide riboside transporter PnuC [Pedobacter sp. SYSU D00535]